MRTEITDKLDRMGVAYTVKPHRNPVFTSEDAARERGVRLCQIVKTMVLSDGRQRVVVAVLPGDRRLDTKRLKKLVRVKNLKFMDQEALSRRFDMVIGAIAPIADAFESLSMFMDPAVLQEAFIDISSGSPSAGLELASADLQRLLPDAQVATISRPA